MLQQGAKTWFFITADYAFGHDLEKQFADEVIRPAAERSSARRAIRSATRDFASFLLQAQASGAQVVALANAGGDTTNSVKQAAEFEIGARSRRSVADLRPAERAGARPDDRAGTCRHQCRSTGTRTTQTRAWSQRFQDRHPKKMMPNHMHAGVYAGVLHYLKAVDKVGSPADGRAVVAAMKAMPTDDPLFGKGTIRADGRKIHPMYLLQVKTPAESKSEWDVLKICRRPFRPTRHSGR